jgi:hypothetical protein
VTGTPDTPLAIYEVRTAPGYWLAAGVLFALAGFGGSALVFVALTGSRALLAPGVAILALAVVVPVIYWFASSAYRIGGGRSAIRFFPDRLEVPAAVAGPPLRFPRSELHADVQEMRVRYRIGGFAAATVRRGHLVRLAAGSTKRALSTLTLVRPGAFLADLERYVGGEPPRGPEAHASTSVRSPDDDRLDSELAALD